MVADCSVSLHEMREENQEPALLHLSGNKPFEQTVPTLAGAKSATAVSNDAMTPRRVGAPGANNDPNDPAK